MPREQSLYLDALRFSLALVVFIGHASGANFTAGAGWQLQSYGQTAVIGFFVLSGFVIGFVTDTRDRGLTDYIVNRVSRLYSVILPSLILTLACTFASIHLSETTLSTTAQSGAFLATLPSDEYLRILLSAIQANNVWQLKFNPTINEPFWSLPFEFFYYLMFAALFYLRGWRRLAFTGMCAAFAGPTIILLFPLWLIGYLSYRSAHLASRTSLPAGALISAGSLLVALSAQRPFGDITLTGSSDLIRDRLPLDYIEGLFFAVHLLYSRPLAAYLERLLNRFSGVIVTLGAATFPLYLMHRPLIEIIPQLTEQPPESTWNRIVVFIGTGFFVLLMTPFIDRLKNHMRRSLSSTHLLRSGRKVEQ